ncbi:ATP-dependent nuclease [Pontibacillus yanchengensis]|uniref:Uncharacterized protein n=1 Tax=Pontibacillus yanchengensis Y32 TaxID=1385514 RepID=A0A0A2TJB0_9BACI|nr:AAA family ATPase [Pontibacillus yanchengensis]KGP74523.1 hypothetical protein N782_12725 [Pontibacillus yanchengensis Y32]
MRLKTVTINNYRTFEDATFEFSNYGVVIGANNSGKTSVFSLLDKILNPFKSLYYSEFEVSDFRVLDEPLVVNMTFDFLSEVQMSEFKFHLNRVEMEDFQSEEEKLQIYLKYECIYESSTESFSKKLYIISGDEQFNMSEKQRKLFPFIYRGAQRDNRTELRMGRNTFLSRLLDTVEIDGNAKESIQELMGQASDILSEQLKNISNLIEQNSKHVIDYPIKPSEDEEKQNIRFNLLNLESEKLLNNLEIYILEAFKSDFESLTKQGLGYQNAIVLAIFKSFATSAIKGDLILALEEPELFLPPHAQRALARDFKELSSENQILIATHSPSFMLSTNPKDIVILRRLNSGMTSVSQFNKNASKKDIEWFSKRINAINGEAFFSNVVLLVEGETEEGAINELSYKLDAKNSEYSFDKYGITIINCGGKSKIKDFNRLVKYFSLPTVALIDFDPDGTDPNLDRDEGEVNYLSSVVDNLKQLPRDPEWGDFEGVLSKEAPINNLLQIIEDLEMKKVFCGQLIKISKELEIEQDIDFIKDVSANEEDIQLDDLIRIKEHIKSIDHKYIKDWYRAGIRDTLKRQKSVITGDIIAANLSGNEIPNDFAGVIMSCVELSRDRF